MLGSALDWVLRALIIALGAGALLGIAAWLRMALRERREAWALRMGVAMLLLAALYAFGHLRMLTNRAEIEAGRAAYARYGDPRLAEQNRAELRGWILDCTGRDANAFARYSLTDGEVQRTYPLGEAGANLIGGGDSAQVRDYTVERLFADRLRRPRNWREDVRMHPAGTDLRLTLCADATRQAATLLAGTGRQGAVIVQDVGTGAVLAYAATGGPTQAPFGIKRYALPGSVFKLALSAIWWENGFGDRPMACPPSIVVKGRPIRNFESEAFPSLNAPREMLVVSCNTLAIRMWLELRDRLGPERIATALRRFGFIPYSDKAPRAEPTDFWNTDSEAWAQRMTPPPARVRFRTRYDPFEWAQIAIGQGPVDVTPIAISRFVQAIGNGGVMLPPSIEADRLKRAPEGRPVMQPATAARLQDAMRGVVDEGTARSTATLVHQTGWDMGGKTGTADIRRGQTPDGWFAGLIFGPDGKPRYTVVVYLEQGGQGGRLPAGVAARMLRFFVEREGAGGTAARRAG